MLVERAVQTGEPVDRPERPRRMRRATNRGDAPIRERPSCNPIGASPHVQGIQRGRLQFVRIVGGELGEFEFVGRQFLGEDFVEQQFIQQSGQFDEDVDEWRQQAGATDGAYW